MFFNMRILKYLTILFYSLSLLFGLIILNHTLNTIIDFYFIENVVFEWFGKRLKDRI